MYVSHMLQRIKKALTSSLGVGRRLAAVSLVVAGSLVALSACSGSDDPGADAAQSPSASVSETVSLAPSPSATYKPASAEGPAENVPLPVMPEEAKVDSKEGLIAFARYWYELVNYGYETGDVQPIKTVSRPECTDCSRYYRVVSDGYDSSDWIVGAHITVLGIDSAYVLTSEGRYQVLVQFKQDAFELQGPDNRIYDHYPGTDRPVVQMLEAHYKGHQWIVDELRSM
ncbi:DUF6318 family protein [Arthrobacter sp. NPDC055585]